MFIRGNNKSVEREKKTKCRADHFAQVFMPFSQYIILSLCKATQMLLGAGR